MARLLHLAILAISAILTLAAPAPAARSLAKRSFQAKAPGRRILSPMEDFVRVQNKYSKYWEIVVAGANGNEEATPSSSSSVTITSTLYSTPSSTGVSSGAAPAPYGNSSSTSTSSAPMAYSTGGSEDGSVAATPPDSTETEYLSPVTIGGQTLNLDFDTGSADLWVYGNGSTSTNVAVFDPSLSPTWKLLAGEKFEISYGDGSGAIGIVGTDVVDVGGSTVQKQAVEVAQDVAGGLLRDDDLDGLLGLSFSSINSVLPNMQLTFFDNVKSDLSEPVFTADLEESTGKGTYDFGTIDRSKYNGDIHYTPVNNTAGWWQITTPTMVIDGKEHDCSNCSQAVLDTGTTLMYLEVDVVAKYYSNVPNSTLEEGLYGYPCSEVENLPSFGVGIGDWVAHIKGPDMNYGYMTENGVTCMGGLQPVTSVMPNILGDVFLKQFFVVFDGGEIRAGIADKD